MSLKSSSKLRNILEVRGVRGSPDGGRWGHGGLLGCDADLPGVSPQIVLAFGNYMNSSKRGAAYGFRLQSLDAVRWVQVWCGQAVSLHGGTPWEQRDAVTCCGWGGYWRQPWGLEHVWRWKGVCAQRDMGTSYGEGGRAAPSRGQWGSGMQGRADIALSQLLEMKSTDRKQTLLHYLVRVITEKYPELTGFHTELHFLDKAGTGSTCGHGAGGHGGYSPHLGTD